MTLRVLLADDQRLLRDLLRDLLQRQPDIEVVGEASNGLEAMAQLAAHHPGVRVICLSGYSDRRYVLQMLRAGAAGYVLKSEAGTELLRAIRAVAAGQSYLCPAVAAGVISDVRTSASATGGLTSLGKRERQVLQLLAEGRRSSEIARRLCISIATVDTHRRNLMRKLDLHTVAELTKFAIREGLTPS